MNLFIYKKNAIHLYYIKMSTNYQHFKKWLINYITFANFFRKPYCYKQYIKNKVRF
jgi:hypothetical protein